MITSDTLVQIKKSGASVPAGLLQIGDTIYDGFAGRTREIIDVRRRCVGTRLSPELAPVVIRWGTVGQGVPTRDVHFSPQQQFLCVSRPQDAIPYLESHVAKDLATDVDPCRGDIFQEITYVALFFDAPCYLICSGVITLGYTPSVFADYPEHLRRRA